MKNTIIFLILFLVGFAYVAYLSVVRDPKLMQLCSDHTTQKLYECK